VGEYVVSMEEFNKGHRDVARYSVINIGSGNEGLVMECGMCRGNYVELCRILRREM